MKGIVFDDGGVFWWNKEESAENVLYRIYMNGELVAETEKTHFGAKELIPDSEYILTAETVGADGCIAKRENFKFRTKRRKRRIDVTAAPYFAAGDGKTLNTAALQKALDDCTKDCAVYFPAGIYLSGALRVHSDTEIIIGENAVLQGAEDPCDYLPKIKSRFEGIERMCYASLLNIGALCRDKGAVCRNVAIRGGGAVSGGGRVLAENIIARERTLYNAGECSPPEGETPEDSFGRARGRLINISNAENVCIGDLKLTGGPSWNVHMVYSSGIVTYNCKFFSEGVHNGDGWDPDSSKNCTIFGCTFETGDDCIAIKSGKNPEGNKIAKPSKNIEIFDCASRYGHGIAIGSEISGGIENVRIWDCDFEYSGNGITIKSQRKRGGYIRGIDVRNCKFSGVLIQADVKYNADGESAEELSVLENFLFENISLTGRCYSMTRDTYRIPAVQIEGYAQDTGRVKNVRFRNVHISRYSEEDAQVISVQNAEELTFENISVTGVQGDKNER